jgi:hypothetical protein
MARSRRWLFVALLALAAPFQATMAIAGMQAMTVQQDQAGDGCDQHPQGNGSASHCNPSDGCCAATAIAAAVSLVPCSASSTSVNSRADAIVPGDTPDRLERPPLHR